MKTICYAIIFLLCSIEAYAQTSLPGSGNAVRFDGIDDAIICTPQNIAYDNFTIEAWVSPTAVIDLWAETTYSLFGTQGDNNKYLIYPTDVTQLGDINTMATVGITVGTNGVCVFENSDFYAPCLLTWPSYWNGWELSNWTHIAVVYIDRTPSLYVDGVYISTGLQSTRARVYASNLIGGGYWGHFQGNADEIRIWDIPLTQDQIRESMHRKINSADALFPKLVNYYNMDESTGDVVNDFGKADDNGLLTNGANKIKSGALIGDQANICCTACGNAVHFDGIDDEIGFTQQKIAYDNFTMEAWVYPTDGTAIFFEKNYGPEGGLGTNRYVTYPSYDNQFEGSTSTSVAGFTAGINGITVFDNGKAIYEGDYPEIPPLLSWGGSIWGWTHIAIVYIDRQPSLYVNAVLVRTGVQSQRAHVYPSNFIGGGYWGHFLGDADEIRIWDIPLTQSQIQERMHKRIHSSDPLYPNLVNYYKLDEASGNLVYDYGKAGVSGQLINGAHRITCGAPLSDAGEYCNAKGTSNAKGYIKNAFACYGFNNTTGWNGYADFTNKSVTSAPGKLMGFSITPGYVSCPVPLYPKMWIDWNGDGDFTDHGERVFAPSTAITLKTKFWIRVPAGTSPGNKRIRIALLADIFPQACGTYTYGDVEDYTVKIVAARQGIVDADENDFDEAGNTFTIYPNPAVNRMTIERSGYSEMKANNAPAQMIMTDANGKAVMHVRLNNLVQAIDVSHIANGIYFVTIINNNNSSTNKIIISR